MTLARAIKAIDKSGIRLVFPLANSSDPPSLWSELHPRTKMRWAWDDGADGRVVALWHLRERLAESRKVVYTKWFRGRATFISRPVFRAMLGRLQAAGDPLAGLPRESYEMLEILEDNSPQSTKELKRQTELQGRALEAVYTRALRELWSRLLVVGAGEVDDGAFPSLAIGATKLLFEDLWLARETPDAEDARLLEQALHASPKLRRELAKALASVTAASRAAPPAPAP